MTQREKFIDKWIAGRKSRTATMKDLNSDLDKVILSETEPIREVIAYIQHDIDNKIRPDLITLEFIRKKLSDAIEKIEKDHH